MPWEMVKISPYIGLIKIGPFVWAICHKRQTTDKEIVENIFLSTTYMWETSLSEKEKKQLILGK